MKNLLDNEKTAPTQPVNVAPELIDHIGWQLWCAANAWKKRYTEAMVARGFTWVGEARGNLIQHIDRTGIAQTELAKRANMSKQAVQQHLDDLVKDGVIARVADKQDARRKLIQFTPAGLQALAAANDVKRAIEEDYRQLVGADSMACLQSALAALIADEKPR